MRVSTERCTAWTSARNWATYHLQQEQYCPDVALSIMPDQCQKLGSLPLTQLVSRNNTVQLLHCSTSARNWAIYSQVRNNIVCPTVTSSIVPDQCQKLGHLPLTQLTQQGQHCPTVTLCIGLNQCQKLGHLSLTQLSQEHSLPYVQMIN